MKKKPLIFTCLFLIYQSAFLQNDYSSSQIYHLLNKLEKHPSVLYIAAHPDDENTRLISYLTNKLHYRTGYLSLTKGSGGQNLIGDEKSSDLGLLRAQELLSARQTDGGEQFFSRAYDFGYSKSPDETLSKWNKDSILKDMVFIIRYFKPDVIITRFNADSKRGHGHHTASAIMAAEAFTLANDSNAFAEQLQFVSLWQPQRLLYNSTRMYWNPNADVSDLLPLNVGEYVHVLGKNTGEISAESRSMHKSQGFGVRKRMGKQLEYFKILNGDTTIKFPFEKLQYSQNTNAEKNIHSIVTAIKKEYNLSNPEEVFHYLTKLHKQFIKLNDNYRKGIVEQLMLAVNGIKMNWSSNHEYCLTNQPNPFTFKIIKQGNHSVQVNKVRYKGKNISTTFDTSLNVALVSNEQYSFTNTITFSPQDISQPYWLEQEPSTTYRIKDLRDLKYPYEYRHNQATIELTIQGYPFKTDLTLNHFKLIPNVGEIEQPLIIIPPLSIAFANKSYTQFENDSKEIQLELVSYQSKPMDVNISLVAPKEWDIQPNASLSTSLNAKEKKTVAFNVTPEQKNKDLETTTFYATAETNEQIYDKSVVEVDYSHIEKQVWFPKAKANIIHFEKRPNMSLHIAYIMGSGDEVAKGLQDIGFKIDFLNANEIDNSHLEKYQAIILGIRAFNVHKNLISAKKTLWSYVKNGGTVIIQYNTNNWVGRLEDTLTPDYFHISRNRVTDENSPVKFLLPKHKIFHYPYSISQQDFKYWVQERGIYFSDTAESSWIKPIAFKDFNSPWDDGSLLISTHGKGAFIYTGLSFFREIPAGVRGAIRLFTNLIYYKP